MEAVDVIGFWPGCDRRVWTVPFVNWPYNELCGDPRFRQFFLSAGYLDVAGVLTVEEARQINAETRIPSEPDRRLGSILSDESLNTSFVLVWIWELDIGDAADGIAQEADVPDSLSPLGLRLIRILADEPLEERFPSRSAAFGRDAKVWLAELRECAT